MFVINIHSLIDVITNSSTEMFVTSNKKSIETVKEILEKIVQGYNVMTDKNLRYEDVFKEPHFATPDDIEVWEEYAGYYRKDSEFIPSIDKKHIVIYSAQNNSVPYEIWGTIEAMLAGDRLHLG